MLIMAEVTSEMGAELRASAMAAGTSVAAEVGRRLERLDRLEASFSSVEAALRTSPDGEVTIVQPVNYRFVDNRDGSGAAFVRFPDTEAELKPAERQYGADRVAEQEMQARADVGMKGLREKFGGR